MSPELNDSSSTMVLVVRSDLKLSTGKIVAQTGHAAVEVALKAKRNETDLLARWRSEGARKIALKVPDEDTLKQLYREATDAGFVTYLVKDAGHTEIPPGTLTVVGILGPRRSVDFLVGELSLL
ncbi:MAG: aminoacyl-tRNA hydrolase, partial [Candidatus Thermoplasmatota archaeon]|nr:aminoacyl-tRNA hydrolase [Candidatus Thermoplasmatota archaeon]